LLLKNKYRENAKVFDRLIKGFVCKETTGGSCPIIELQHVKEFNSFLGFMHE